MYLSVDEGNKLIVGDGVGDTPKNNNYRMAKTTKWLNAILSYISEGSISHINGVWPCFLTSY